MASTDTANSLVREISKLTARLVETGMVDSQNAVSKTLHQGRGWTVAQPGADMSQALKKQPYAQLYADLVSTGNYTMRLLDGALIQFSYSGLARGLLRHRLAYLPAPDLEPYQTDPDLYFGEHHFLDVVGHQVMPVPLRFDFDARSDVAKDLIHPVSHLTLGQYQHCRVPVTKAFTPAAFMSFVLASFYSTPDRPQEHFASQIHLGASTISVNEAARTHLALP